MLEYTRPKGFKDTIERMEAVLDHKIKGLDDLVLILTGVRDMNDLISKELDELRYLIDEIPTEEGRLQCAEDIRILKKYRILAWVAGRQYANIRNFAMEQYATFDVVETKIMRMTEGIGQVESDVIKYVTDFTTPGVEQIRNMLNNFQDRA